MSSISINSSTHINDALERQLLQDATTNNQAYPLVQGLVLAAKAVRKGAVAFGRYLVHVGEALNEARAMDARYSGSQW